MRSKTFYEYKQAVCWIEYTLIKEFEFEHSEKNAKPSALAFNGDVYKGLKAETFDQTKMDFAQKDFRILSSLYGLMGFARYDSALSTGDGPGLPLITIEPSMIIGMKRFLISHSRILKNREMISF